MVAVQKGSGLFAAASTVSYKFASSLYDSFFLPTMLSACADLQSLQDSSDAAETVCGLSFLFSGTCDFSFGLEVLSLAPFGERRCGKDGIGPFCEIIFEAAAAAAIGGESLDGGTDAFFLLQLRFGLRFDWVVSKGGDDAARGEGRHGTSR